MSDEFSGVIEAVPASSGSVDSTSLVESPSGTESSASPASVETTAPSSPDSTQTAKKHEPFVPYDRFSEVNESLRKLKEQYGWLDDNLAPRIKTFVEGYRQNPADTLLAELQALMQHPQHSQTIRSTAARLLGMRQGQPSSDPDAIEPQYQTPDGQPIYTATQVQQLIERAVTEKVQPFAEDLQTRQARDQLQTMQGQAMQTAKVRFAQLEKLPHFTEHKDRIKELYRTTYTEENGYGPHDGLYAAYTDVLTNEVLPRAGEAGRSQVLSSLQAKSGASSVNPGRPSMPPPAEPPKDFREALERQLSG